MRMISRNFEPSARREEGAYPQRSVTDEQQRQRAKEPKDGALGLGDGF
jgi:hypothetical protein